MSAYDCLYGEKLCVQICLDRIVYGEKWHTWRAPFVYAFRTARKHVSIYLDDNNDTRTSMNRRLYCTWAIVTSTHGRTSNCFSYSTRFVCTRFALHPVGFSFHGLKMPCYALHECNNRIERNIINMHLTRGFFSLSCCCCFVSSTHTFYVAHSSSTLIDSVSFRRVLNTHTHEEWTQTKEKPNATVRLWIFATAPPWMQSKCIWIFFRGGVSEWELYMYVFDELSWLYPRENKFSNRQPSNNITASKLTS